MSYSKTYKGIQNSRAQTMLYNCYQQAQQTPKNVGMTDSVTRTSRIDIWWEIQPRQFKTNPLLQDHMLDLSLRKILFELISFLPNIFVRTS